MKINRDIHTLSTAKMLSRDSIVLAIRYQRLCGYSLYRIHWRAGNVKEMHGASIVLLNVHCPIQICYAVARVTLVVVITNNPLNI